MRGTSGRRVRLLTVAVGVAGTLLATATPLAAQDISVNFGQGTGLTERVIQMIALLTVLVIAILLALGTMACSSNRNARVLFSHADKALHRAKEEGRNRVVVDAA